MSTIKEDLEFIDIPNKIKNDVIKIADSIHKKTNVYTRQGKNRKYLLYVSCLIAYRQNNIFIDYYDLGRLFGFNKKKNIIDAINKYPEYITGIPITNKNLKASDYIYILCKNTLKINDEYIEEMLHSFNIFIKKNEDFEINNNNRTIAIAYIKYYILFNENKQIKTIELKQIFKTSQTSINNMVNMIDTLSKE